MVRFKDFEAVVRVNGEALQEYDAGDNDPPADEDTLIRYIEVQNGAKFGVDIRYVGEGPLPGPSSIKGVEYIIEVDGTLVRSVPNCIAPYSRFLKNRVRSDGNASYSSDLVFSNLNIDEELDHCQVPNFQTLQRRLLQVGTLKLTIQRLLNLKPTTVLLNTATVVRAPLDGSSAIPEKALKGHAKSHFVSFGGEEPIAMRYMVSERYDNKPYATFEFKYRSRPDTEALEHLRIISRDPTPAPEPVDLSTLSRDELLELAQSQRQQLQAIPEPNVKQEPSASAVGNVKRERVENGDEIVVTEARRVRQRASESNGWANGEIVDLTGD